MLIRYLVIAFLMCCIASPFGLAATFDVKPKSGDSTALVIVIGDFELGDEKKFIQAVLPLDTAIVVLTSNGGNLYAGVEIGKAIRLKSLSTLVPKGSVCASACAIAWLAGDHRFVDVDGQVGFHAAYTEDARRKIPSGTANAVIGAYLNQLGFSQSAVIYVTSAPPEGIQWLSELDAKKNGVEATFLSRDVAKQSDIAVTSPVSIAPSFDCKRAGSEDEVAICQNNELAEKDGVLAQLFRSKLRQEVPSVIKVTKAEQREWLRSRRLCKADIACLNRIYDLRLTSLSSNLPTIPSQRTSVSFPSFDCNKALTADEIVICQNSELSEKDRSLARLFNSKLRQEVPSAIKVTKAEQREWLRSRRSCGANVACLHKSKRSASAALPAGLGWD
jgi:uncharacterized protein